MVYKASIDVKAVAKASAEKASEAYKAEKAKDAEAGLAGASSHGAELPPIDPVEMDFDDPEELERRIAADLGSLD